MKPEMLMRLGYGHLDRQTWRYRHDLVTPRTVSLYEILSEGIFGVVTCFPDGPAIIVHNRLPNQVEVRLRWLGAKIDVNTPLEWVYAPDVADMMLDKTKLLEHFRYTEIMDFLEEWALLQDWGRTPEIREQ